MQEEISVELSQSPSKNNFSPYLDFSRETWATLRAATPLTLSEADLQQLCGFNEAISLTEVETIYLPLSRLLNLYFVASQQLYQVTDKFLGHSAAKVPYVIGIAGSVAVGKSTTARILQALLRHWPDHPTVDLVTTDGFLYPNRVLKERGLMQRKGFPKSYNLRRLIKFVADVKSGRPKVTAPVYSHLTYDIVPGELQTVEQPDIVIIEGLNILQSGQGYHKKIPPTFVSDFFDFSIYVDAAEANLEQWYINRFLRLRQTAFQDRASYFHHYAELSIEEAKQTARHIWQTINRVNLKENIEPTRERARLILEKGDNHVIQRVRLRKL